LQQLDPDRALRGAQVRALDDMARSGKIDWAEWAQRVREIYRDSPEFRSDELADALAAAADARARQQPEVARQQTNDERER
jgi:hypothetical protein